jgi:histidinol dehydrogenase
MGSPKVRRIDLSASNGRTQLAKFIDSWHRGDAEVVSAAGKKLTQQVFGQPLTPAQAVETICKAVRDDGVAAVIKYTELFDKVKLKPEAIRVDEAELAAAHKAADPEYLEVLRRIRYNVESFQSGLLNRDAELRVSGQHELSMRYRPLNRIGVYCPGGAAAYPSTLLMTVVPAQAAGVKEIVVCMPPKENGASNKDMLAACYELGISEVYRIGGAQAVAAMAYGVEGLQPVEMIVGPAMQSMATVPKTNFLASATN